MIKSFQVTLEGSWSFFLWEDSLFIIPIWENPAGHKDPWITYILLTPEIVFQSCPAD